ncbi:TetR/AcrR family transcriptional regulator [Acinetobacter pittii]|uniref:TetR/AcrR family transcriptional regulator n=2 Tax=Moraxellaceae TaxID=468 RepID=A0A8I1KYJ3_ACIPI|nr:TetR/AcrR family transcriptional regulator [Acinetobacter pittii]MBK1443955.1 TetR/AcrR family transcriptional regulator [Acinetobacter pittii]MBQ5176731.1 TetR/AcrR family transcriptional regulator [Acinetobacter pittii]OTM42832.1 TetR family transcriptional regulator [Acinetobacter pittii]OTT09432.1 TetR family transcriptional regulator [Acinetobacter pittii]
MPSTVLRLCCAFFSPKKGTGFLSHLDTTRIYNGKTMPTLEISSKKLQVVQTAIQLFTTHGFHNAGVDLIIKKSKIQKATFYNYFHSKERLVEMCLIFQKSRLKEEVLAIVYSHRYPTAADKLKEIVRLHVDVNSFYHLLFKAIFELKLLYPQAYRMAVEYRKWLLKELFDLIFSLESRGLKPDADMVLNLIDGLMFGFLSTNSLSERDEMLERFFKIT